MSFFSFSREAAAFDMTPIENDFLMNYMPAAPEKALRVYLYARMLCLHPEIGELADMAKALRMDRDEVLDAFQYWEQRGLVEKLSDQPPRYELRSLRDSRITQNPIDMDVYKYGDLHAALDGIFGMNVLEKRHYLKVSDWLDTWGLSQDAALEIVKYEKRLPGGQTPDSVLKRADRRAKEWAEQGIREAGEVKQTIAFEDRAYQMAAAVLERLAIRRGVTQSELDCARRWIGEWNLTMDDVIEACAQTTKSRKPSIGYLDAILKSQVESNSSVHFDAMKEVLRELNAANAAPTPEQLNAYAQFLQRGFEPETIRLAAVQNARKNRNRFQDLEWMLNSWGEAGVYTRAQAEVYIRELTRKSEEMGALMKAAGLTRHPNRADLEYYERWSAKHTPELLRCAAELSQGAREPVRYMDKLLSNWADAGITTPEAARAAAPRAAKGAQGTVPSQRGYQQHEYKESDFGEDFYYDPARDYGKEGDKK